MAELMSENRARMNRGELYYAFTPELVKERTRCHEACQRYNDSRDTSRRKRVEMWRDITADPTPLPPPAATSQDDDDDDDDDDDLFADDPWIEHPIHIDYGTNVKLGKNVFINFNCTIIDTCLVTIGDRCLLGPDVSIYAGTHPLDPGVRNGTQGPESGAEVHIEEDCWLGGRVTVLAGVRVGKGSTVGAGSVVTRDVAPYTVVAGIPARKLRDVPRNTKAEETSGALAALERDRARRRRVEDPHLGAGAVNGV